MKIVNIDSRDCLNNFIVQYGQSNFLQSWEWGEFQKAQGKYIWRLGIEEKGELIASTLLIKKTLPLGRSYLYCPRGPVFSNQESGIRNYESKIWELFLAKIREIGKKEGAIFFRFDFPNADLPDCLVPLVCKSPVDVQPKHTLILDIRKSEEEILAAMKPKTRYNIRLAERKGVKLRSSLERRDLDTFWKLLRLTTKRSNFKPHPKIYYQKMVEILGKKDLLKMFIAEYKGEILAVNIVLFFGRRATYLHGASSNEHRNVMAPHLLQWEEIREAKRRGCTEYDFWGIASEVQSSKFKVQSREGITRFKKGFGGQEVCFTGTYDLVLNKFWYKIYKICRRVK